MMHFLVPAFTAAGVHVACPNYRLAPKVGLDEIVEDCRGAITFLHRNGRATGVDPGPLSVLGHSAAGQLAAVMASTDWSELDPRLPVDLVRHWVGVSGFYDIEPFALTGFQSRTAFTTDAYSRWNPVNLVRADMPSGLLITGEKESRPPPRNDGRLCPRARSRGCRSADRGFSRGRPLFGPQPAGGISEVRIAPSRVGDRSRIGGRPLRRIPLLPRICPHPKTAAPIKQRFRFFWRRCER